MGTTDKSDNVIKEHNCVTLGKIDIYKKIDSDTRKQEWDFLKGCWRERTRLNLKIGWDLRYTN